MTIVKKLFPYVLIVGLVCWAFGLAYTGLTILTEKTIDYGTYQWTYWEIDVNAWLKSVESALTNNSIVNIVPTTPELPKTPNWADILSILKFAFNAFFIWVANCLIYALNWIILAPLKLVLYPINLLYAIFGINTADEGWIYAFNLMYSFEIPLIKPI